MNNNIEMQREIREVNENYMGHTTYIQHCKVDKRNNWIGNRIYDKDTFFYTDTEEINALSNRSKLIENIYNKYETKEILAQLGMYKDVSNLITSFLTTDDYNEVDKYYNVAVVDDDDILVTYELYEEPDEAELPDELYEEPDEAELPDELYEEPMSPEIEEIDYDDIDY